MAQVSQRITDGDRWVVVKYQDGMGVMRDHRLEGNKVGYKSNENNNGIFRIYADDKTFGIPLSRLVEFKMQNDE